MEYARTLDELDPATVADRALCVAELRGKTDVYDKMRQLTEYAQRGPR